MVKIRLARGGAKKRPYYRIVVADSHKKRDGRFIERIGFYNPMVQENRFGIDGERAKYWLSVGAQPTDRVRKLMEKAEIL
ncbi:MAG TPA: 30S ribosomal protein S16 [Deltaproteobacteria bacterium]|nr:30S ribosomal protein S16 [Deltaproteobacteria bacterium]